MACSSVDPSAQILGAVMFGWSEYMSLNTAPDAATYDAKYGNYVTYFLESMKALEAKHKRRLVHALDVHWYPEMRGAKRITEPDTSRKTVDARLAAPRSLWDPTFNENTWITDQLGKPITASAVVEGPGRRALPGHQAGDDRIQLRRRAAHLGRAGAGGRARDPGPRGRLPSPTTGARAPRSASCRRTSRRRFACIATTTASNRRSVTRRSARRPPMSPSCRCTPPPTASTRGC